MNMLSMRAPAEVRPPAPQETADIWVLLTSRQGDNHQLIALAEALGRPYRCFTLDFKRLRAALPPLLLGATLKTLSTPCDWTMAPPWPAAVLASGRRSVPIAYWIRRQSGHSTRLIHLGRPWAPLHNFDLVVTTPQYGVPARHNVLENLLPFVSLHHKSTPLLSNAMQASLQHLPRPWTVVLVGGSSRPYAFDARIATRLAQRVNAIIETHGGSALVLGGPRTSPSCMDAIERTVEGPAYFYRWNQGVNPYQALHREADRFLVSGDSASMISEALLSARPVELFELPRRPDWRWRLAAFDRLICRHVKFLQRLYDLRRDCGLLSSVRDIGAFHHRLREAGLFDDPQAVRQLARLEQQRTVNRVLAAIGAGSQRMVR